MDLDSDVDMEIELPEAFHLQEASISKNILFTSTNILSIKKKYY